MEGYPHVKEILQRAQWLIFVQKNEGFHKGVTKSFARAFDGVEVEIRYIKFSIIESFISEATRLPKTREIWFKNRGIEGEGWKIFLKKPRYGY